MRPAAPNAIPIIYEINNEFNKLNNGLLAESLRQAGTLEAIINSKRVEVTARISIIDRSIIYPFVLIFFHIFA
jgi:hypothetical protein